MHRTSTFLFLALATSPAQAADWPQWGGPSRDFHAPDAALSREWPADGPKRLWSRELGEGYSGIAAAGGRLYTMYRVRDEEEIVAAFSAATGELLWEHRYATPMPEGMRLGYGKGPHSTPLVAAGSLFTVGTTARMWALDAETGAPLWSHDLWGELGGNRLRRGYAASPIAYRDIVIVPVGEEGHGMVAFAAADGRVVWRAGDFKASQASPILIEVDGREQLVAFVSDEAVALDPASGSLLWRHPHPAGASYNISTPVWGPDNLLFLSSAYGGGSRMLRLGAGNTVEEVWASSRMRLHFTNAVRLDDAVYAASGRSSVLLTALDAATGELLWKERRVGRANLLVAGGDVLLLEEDGRLILASLTREGLTVHADSKLVESKTWTAPTLVGSKLYVRDGERLFAVELPAVVSE